MADIGTLFTQTVPAYQKPEDLDFPVSKIRLFMDVLWQSVTGKALTEEQKTTLKQLIELLNLLDEHKHKSEKELIAAMLPSISPLLQKMPTLGLTGTHVFAHLVPMYQLYLPSIEAMVKDAHPFTMEETLLYYQSTIFDHLFLVHIFESESNINMIELLLTIKALILSNALVYDYHQHVSGRSISFFTFLMRGGLSGEQLLPFLEEAVSRVKEEAKQTVTNQAALDTLEFITTKLMDTTKTPDSNAKTNEEKEIQKLETVMQPTTPTNEVKEVMNQVTETPVEPTVTSTPAEQPAPIPSAPVVPETPAPIAETTPAPTAPETPTVAEPGATPTPTTTESPMAMPALPTEPTPPATPAAPAPAQPEAATQSVAAPASETPLSQTVNPMLSTTPVPSAAPAPETPAAPATGSPLSENPILSTPPTASVT